MNTMGNKINLSMLTLCLLLFLSQGCATTIRAPKEYPKSPKVKFSEFSAIEYAHVTISPKYASSSSNKKAAKKIDEILLSCLRPSFPNLQEATQPAPGTGSNTQNIQEATQTAPGASSNARTLLIEPLIEEIKFIGGAARFWVGAMAGSSAVLMKVTYRDKATGEVIAEPEFYQKGNAFGGGWSIGGTDNLMLENVARDICNYTNNSH